MLPFTLSHRVVTLAWVGFYINNSVSAKSWHWFYLFNFIRYKLAWLWSSSDNWPLAHLLSWKGRGLPSYRSAFYPHPDRLGHRLLPGYSRVARGLAREFHLKCGRLPPRGDNCYPRQRRWHGWEDKTGAEKHIHTHNVTSQRRRRRAVKNYTCGAGSEEPRGWLPIRLSNGSTDLEPVMGQLVWLLYDFGQVTYSL